MNEQSQDETKDLKAISLSWYGYSTTKPIPPMVYIVWRKLNPQTQKIFYEMAEKNLGAGA